MFRHLLPNKYKKLGWGLILFSPVFLILFKNSVLALEQLEDIASIIALLGLSLTIGSAEKVEDERTGLFRFKALALAFFVIISCTLTSKLFSLFDPFCYFFPHNHTKGSLFIDTPIGTLFLAAIFYHLNFRGLLKDEK